MSLIWPTVKLRAWMRDHSRVTLSTKMAENNEPAKRARKPNFTAAECTLLLTVAEENINIIKNKFTNAITNKNKTKVWEEITEQVNRWFSRYVTAATSWWKKTKDLSLAHFVRPPAIVHCSIIICVPRDWLQTTCSLGICKRSVTEIKEN